MFKASLGEVELMKSAVWMMLSVVGLLLGLGGYVYLGAKAERILLKNRMVLCIYKFICFKLRAGKKEIFLLISCNIFLEYRFNDHNIM